jgi:hypothetical protein
MSMAEHELAHQLITYIDATTESVSVHTTNDEPPTELRPRASADSNAAEFRVGSGGNDAIDHFNDHDVDSEREIIMLAPNDDERSTARSRWLLAAAVIAALALVGGLIVATTRSGDDTIPASPPEPTLTEEQHALSVVEAAYDSFNNGDAEAWVEIRDRGSVYSSELAREINLETRRAEAVGDYEDGERYEDIQCESQGEGEWPVADDGNVSGYYITCDTSRVGEQGLIQQEAFEWVVEDREVVAVRTD